MRAALPQRRELFGESPKKQWIRPLLLAQMWLRADPLGYETNAAIFRASSVVYPPDGTTDTPVPVAPGLLGGPSPPYLLANEISEAPTPPMIVARACALPALAGACA